MILFSCILVVTTNQTIITSESFIEENTSLIIKNNSSYTKIDEKNFQTDNTLEYEGFGNQETFWTYNFHTETIYQINATLLAVGTWCYIYVDNETIEQDGIEDWIRDCEFYRDEFDTVIYPKAIEFAGHPDGNFGDIDGDPHVTLLFSPIYGATGYYAAVNEMPIFDYSNRREMIFIDTTIDLLEVMITIPHEFNHLIWGNNEEEDAPFLMEGGAEYATYYTGYFSNASYLIAGQDYNLTDLTPLFQENPQFSLLCFDRENDDTRIHYGSSYMFFFYLAEKYGLEVAQQLIHTEEDGVQAIELVLSNFGYNVSFNDVYLDWITTCTLDLEGFYENIYSFNNANFRVNPVTTISQAHYRKDDLVFQYYGFDVTKLTSPVDEFTLQVTTPRNPYGLGVVLALYDSNGWNITQNLIFSNEEMIAVYVSGDQIEEAYIITSLMKENPYAPLISYPAPTDELDYIILEGHVQPEIPTPSPTTTETHFFNPILTSLISLVIYTVTYVLRKRKIF